MEENEGIKFLKAWLVVLACLCYSYFIASKIPKGMLRFFSLLPIFSLFTLLPLSLSRPLSNVILSGYITWLANFKLLLYSFNLGPLSTNDPQRSLLKFILLAAFPIKIKEQVKSSNTQKGSFGNAPKKLVPLIFLSKCVLYLILEVYSKYRLVLCCMMYLYIDIAFGVCDLLVRATLGLELEPPSDKPYLSTSLQDFWARRWNRMVSDVLRHTIYKPMQVMTVKLVGHIWAQVLGTMAAFIVSGLMHELEFYHMTRVTPTWEVTWFFVLHGVSVVLEKTVKRVLGDKWKLHWAISVPLTIGFVIVTGLWLFFPPLLRGQVPNVKATDDIKVLASIWKS